MTVKRTWTQTLEDLNVSLNSDFQKGYEPVEANMTKLVFEYSSKKPQGYFYFSKYLAKIAKWEGALHHSDVSKAFKTMMEPVKFSGAVDVDSDEFDDAVTAGDLGLLNHYGVEANGLGMEAKDKPWRETLNWILNGHTSLYGICFDQQNLFDTTHAFDNKAGDQSNLLTGTGVTFETLSADIKAAKKALYGFHYFQKEGDITQKVSLNRTGKLTIFCSEDLRAAFEEVRDMKLVSDGTTSIDNPLQGTFEIETIPMAAADQSDWYMLIDGGKPAEKPVAYQTIKAGILKAPQGTDFALQEYDVLTWSTKLRGLMTYGAWYKIVKTNNT